MSCKNHYYIRLSLWAAMYVQLSSSFCVFAQSGWEVLSVPTSEYLRSVQFINSHTGYAVGTNGTIIKTTDGGNSWYNIPSNTNSTLHSVFFTDTLIGYIVGGLENSATILKTTDGGANWVSQVPPAARWFGAVHFLNPSIGYACGQGLTFIKTSDGGQTWLAQTSTLTWPNYSSLYFTGIDTGYVVGNGRSIRKTTTGGFNWSSVSPSSDSIHDCISIYFTDAQTGFVAGRRFFDPHGFSFGVIMKTTNAGESWYMSLDSVITTFWDLHFPTDSIGYAVGESCIERSIYKTTDAGVSWFRQPYIAGTCYLNSVYFLNPDTGFAVGPVGIMLRTTDGGGPPVSIQNTTGPAALNFALNQNYPNPFNAATTIPFSIPTIAQVTLKVYNILGQEVATLVNEKLAAGNYAMSWEATDFASGVYIYRIQAGDFVRSRKMLLLR
ncbi:MAG: T9SS type A sorting domain-containing protein [Calditrichaceae bacterium]|nr:YCF48-related protein [Calditrichia bacterium]NUQ43224.1 T9SS type A sorting domain-containing protein [Calditrichaceae bacterium]